MKPKKITITYFKNSDKGIVTKSFKTYEDALKWGKKTLTNFNTDLIKIQY